MDLKVILPFLPKEYQGIIQSIVKHIDQRHLVTVAINPVTELVTLAFYKVDSEGNQLEVISGRAVNTKTGKIEQSF